MRIRNPRRGGRILTIGSTCRNPSDGLYFPSLHEWPVEPREAVELQRRLASRVELRVFTRRPRLLAGLDVAFSPGARTTIAGVVVWDTGRGCVVERRLACRATTFPYVPGLLSFRELPAALDAFRALECMPDAVLCDAQGIAHPRRMGLACHLGLWLRIPTIGCAKSRLCGDYGEPGSLRGEWTALLLNEERVGAVLRTRDRVRPLFVSPGHLCDLAAARRITLDACTRYRLPEPTRLAHQMVTRARYAAENDACRT